MPTEDPLLTLEDYELNLILMEQQLYEYRIILRCVGTSSLADQEKVQEERQRLNKLQKDLIKQKRQLKKARLLERKIRRGYAN